MGTTGAYFTKSDIEGNLWIVNIPGNLISIIKRDPGFLAVSGIEGYTFDIYNLYAMLLTWKGLLNNLKYDVAFKIAFVGIIVE